MGKQILLNTVMKNKSKKVDYEEFHKTTLSQTHLISGNNFTYRIILNVVNKYLESPKKILDIGCGAGTLSLYLASKGNDINGIDISSKAIKRCKESAQYLKIKNASFKRMNFPNQIPNLKYDFIICSEVIEHLKNDNMALNRIFDMLKPKGIAIISTPSQNAPLHRWGLVHGFDKRVGHLRRYKIDDLEKKCKSVGFIVLETRKTEGIVRNFLFLNSLAGKFVRFIKFFISDIVTYVDNISLKFLGESQIFIVVQKPL